MIAARGLAHNGEGKKGMAGTGEISHKRTQRAREKEGKSGEGV